MQNKIDEFSKFTMKSAEVHELTFEELFTALVRVSGAYMIDYVNHPDAIKAGLTIDNVLDKFVGYLQTDTKAMFEASKIPQADIPNEN